VDGSGLDAEPRRIARRTLLRGGAGFAGVALVAGDAWGVRMARANGAGGIDGEFAGLVAIGGRSLFLEARGAGGPVVVLEAGAGNSAQIWDTLALPAGSAGPAVFPGVAAWHRICAYDRPNTYLDPDHPGRSDPVAGRRSATDMVADLRALLDTAAVPGPYLLVGHSFGGLITRLFTALYPDDVAGLVLVDAAHEDWWSTLDGLLTDEQRNALLAEPEGFPGLEVIDTEASATQMRDAAAMSPLPTVPMVVITHGRPWDWPPGFPVDEIEEAWMPLQERLAALIPGSELVVATMSGHFIQLDEPDVVIDAIRRVAGAAPTAGVHRVEHQGNRTAG
jgi:pimeloyl-ACP methyl ester carboxylesterase